MKKRKLIIYILVFLILMFLFCLFFFGMIYPNMVFSKNEKTMLAGAKRYFEVNKVVPSDGKIVEVSLKTLIDQKYLEILKMPYQDISCDVKASSVKMKRNKDGISYYPYLVCGSYTSNIDHAGPVISLNGKDSIEISLGSEYQDAGVKRVYDASDGEMSIDEVEVTNHVDTSKVGVYEVVYEAKDSLDNKSVVSRQVKVVERLSSRVYATSSTGVYQGMVDNNYVLLNHLLFRIVKVQENGTILLISNDSLANVNASSVSSFAGSNLDTWLNQYFYSLLEKDYQSLLVKSSWCDDALVEGQISQATCETKSKKRYVGLLSIQNYNASLQGEDSYLNTRYTYFLSNHTPEKQQWSVCGRYSYANRFMASDPSYLLNVRPSVVLKKDVNIIQGDGTHDNPFVLIKEEAGHKGDKIATRHVGEYLTYSGYTFKIMGKEENGMIPVLMNEVLQENGQAIEVGYQDEGNVKIYNPKVKNNLGYFVSSVMSRYIQTNLFAKHDIQVPIYEKEILYQKAVEQKTYSVKVSIPSTFEIFSAMGEDSDSSGYFLLDSSKTPNIKVVVNANGNTYYDYLDTDDYLKRGIRLKAYLMKNVVIKGGSGTKEDPYTIAG